MDQLSKLDYGILELLQEEGDLSIAQMSDRLQYAVSTIRNHIEKLESEGIITCPRRTVNLERLNGDHFLLIFYPNRKTERSEIEKICDENKMIIRVIETMNAGMMTMEVYVTNKSDSIELVKFLESKGRVELHIVRGMRKYPITL